MRYGLIIFLCVIALYACESSYIPRPYGYFRIDFPEKQYRSFDSIYTVVFEIPDYSAISAGKHEKSGNDWLNLSFPRYNATVHITYSLVDGNLEEFLYNTRELTYAHALRAISIEETPYSYPDKSVSGVIYRIKGNVATHLQFYATDSLNHFLRGALYFPVAPNQDSLAPVVNFIDKDIVHLLKTLRWNP